jgi:hypothetical protein
MLVVGESNYAKDDLGATPDEAVAVVNGNPSFIQEVVKRVSISREQSNRTFDAITYLLKQSNGSNIKDVSAETWNSFAYMDVIQCAMMGCGWTV